MSPFPSAWNGYSEGFQRFARWDEGPTAGARSGGGHLQAGAGWEDGL